MRLATYEDLELLEEWDRQEHVIASDPDTDWNWDKELRYEPPWRQQLVAEVDGRPVGFVQIIDPAEEETHYWGDVSKNHRAIDIWIGMPEDLGKGYGSQMMNLSINRCFSNPDVEAILIDPLKTNFRAINFYRRFGFTHIEDRKFGDSWCSVMVLSRQVHVDNCP